MKKITLSLFSICAGFSLLAQTYTFTTASATGPAGPTQGQVNTAYSATNLNGQVTINTQGIQEWTVPATGTYMIEAYGAQGGNGGGQGAYISGEFNLTSGDVLKVLVGQQGSFLGFGSGGGGGSFVTTNANSPLIIAGGGGGSGHTGPGSYTPDGGQITTSGTMGYASGAGLGGTAGNGGESSSSYGGTYNNSGGGGGLLTDGVGNGTQTNPGMAFVNGGVGGYDTGGFGGGGGGISQAWDCSQGNGGGSGGGGYSGGGGGGGSCNGGGGGGGSYNGGTNQNGIPAMNPGDGLVVITSLCAPTVLALDVVNLPNEVAECSATPSTPTATNDCGATINGTPDVSFPITTQGTTVVTWTYDDGVNTISQTQNVVISDVTAPVPDAMTLADSTYDCSVSSIVAPTATDNCSGVVTVTNDAVFPISTAGTTVITWTYDDGNGNTSTQTQNIIINAPNAGVSVNVTTLTSDETDVNATYAWLDCDNGNMEIVGETNQSFTPTITGNYAVAVTLSGCTDTSACILVDFTGIEEYLNNVISLYPNPSKDGNFKIAYDGQIQQIDVMDALGRIIEIQSDLNSGEVNGSALAPGKYIVRIKTDKGALQKDIVIVK